MRDTLIFHQLFEASSSTYTYLLADREGGEAILIDPVLETVDRDLKLIGELGLRLKYVLDTHVHADHVTGAGEIRRRTSAKSVVGAAAQVPCADILIDDGQELRFGRYTIKALSTPGHTDACTTYLCENYAFTGDALLIRGTGRTDFQSGSAKTLYHSIKDKLFRLPSDTLVYPAHDYEGLTHTTIETEVTHNPRVGGGRSEQDFVGLMNSLKFAKPKKIHVALPANIRCGIHDPAMLTSPEAVATRPDDTLVIDVRPQEEFRGPLGHVPDSHRATLGEELQHFLEGYDRREKIVFVCGSGRRSLDAAYQAKQLGFEHAQSMEGGMEAYRAKGLVTEASRG